MAFSYRDAAKTKGGTGRKPFIEPGIEAEMMVILAKLIEGGYKGNSFVFEFKVVNSRAIAAGAEAPPPGAERAYIVNLDDKDYGLKNLMSVAEALNGGPMPGLSDEDAKAMKAAGKSDQAIADLHLDKQEAALRSLLSEAQGIMVKVVTTAVTTKKNTEFTATDWRHVPGQTAETVRANRARI